MIDDLHAVFSYIISSIIGAGGLIISYLMNRSIKRIDEDMRDHKDALKDHDKRHSRSELDLSEFKTHVASNYAKEETMQLSLGRIHDKMEQGFSEIRSDIKTLLTRVE